MPITARKYNSPAFDSLREMLGAVNAANARTSGQAGIEGANNAANAQMQQVKGQQQQQQLDKEYELKKLLLGDEQAGKETLLSKKNEFDAQENAKDRASREAVAREAAARSALTPERVRQAELLKERDASKKALGDLYQTVPAWKQAVSRLPFGIGSVAGEMDPEIRAVRGHEANVTMDTGFLKSGANVPESEKAGFRTAELPGVLTSTKEKVSKVGGTIKDAPPPEDDPITTELKKRGVIK